MAGTEARAVADVNEISLDLAACQAPLNGGVRMGCRQIRWSWLSVCLAAKK
jgi:hypothetical protein